MLIDCDTCAVRDLACDDCVVTVLLGPIQAYDEGGDSTGPPAGHHVDADERRALDVLADSGLVPRLRLVPLGVPDPAAPRRSAAS